MNQKKRLSRQSKVQTGDSPWRLLTDAVQTKKECVRGSYNGTVGAGGASQKVYYNIHRIKVHGLEYCTSQRYTKVLMLSVVSPGFVMLLGIKIFLQGER